MKLKNAVLVSMLVALKALQLAQAGDVSRDANYIVGGTAVPAQDVIAKGTVALVIPTPSGTALCTGSIIDYDLIVTAAHCLANDPGSVRIIFSNQITAASVKDSIFASRYVVHPDYRGDKTLPDQNDIALIEFQGGLPQGFQPNHLLSDSRLLRRGDDVVLAGFGITDSQSQTGAGILRETTVKIVDEDLGKTEILLAQDDGHGACHGDSGGPAFLKVNANLLLWGVTSRGYPNNASDDCAHEVVYTKIMDQMDFIRKAAPKLRQ